MELVIDEIATFWSRWLWPILLLVLGLGLVIFFHELGHFFAAKWAGIKVVRFMVGLGKVFSFRRGETEYRIGFFPMGGYVHMLGQDDFRPQATEEADPRSWQRAPVRKRLVVLAAGVAMNVVFAALAFVVIYMIGIRFKAPVVGGVKADFPAATCRLPQHVAEAMGADEAVGLRPADRIVAMNGRPVRRFRQLAFAALLSGEGETFRLSVVRDVGGRDVEFDVVLKPQRDESEDVPGRPYVFGISSALEITEPAQGHYAGDARFQEGDLIAEIGGDPAGYMMEGAVPLIESAGQPVEVTVIRASERVAVAVQTYLAGRGRGSIEVLEMLGMAARLEIGKVIKDSPAAKAGLKIGDLIVEYAGIENPGRSQMAEANAQLYKKQATIRVLRAGEVVEAQVRPHRKGGETVIGVALLPVQNETLVADVAEGSPAAKAGVQRGAVITRVNDQPVTTWAELYHALKAQAGEDVVLTYTHAGSEHLAPIGRLTKKKFAPTNYGCGIPAIGLGKVEVKQTKPVRGNPAQALAWSVWDTYEFIATTYLSLVRMGQGRVGTGGAAGPVGIGALAIGIARNNVIDFVYFMAMLSVIIAVFNFLPLPVLDGGHAVLLGVEKIRGRPLPPKVQAGIQMVGLALILGLFVALTFQDILRLIK